MRIKLWLLFAMMYCNINAQTQNNGTDSLKKLLETTPESINRVNILENLSYAYLSSSPDSALKYAMDGLLLAKQTNQRKGEAICLDALGNVYFHIGDNAKALELYLEFLKIKEELKDWDNISVAYYNIAGVYVEEQDYKHALFYLFKAKQVDEKARDSSALLYDNYSLASAYTRMQKQDSALFYINQTYALAKQLNNEDMQAAILNIYGDIYLSANDIAFADKYYRQSIPFAEATDDNEVLVANYYGLAKIFNEKLMPDSAISYARKALAIAQQGRFFKQVLEITSFLTGLFKNKSAFDSAFYYQDLNIQIKDSLFNIAEVRKVQDLKFNEQQRQQATETARLKYQNTIRLVVVVGAALALLVIAVLLWRNNRQKQEANILLRQQKEKVETTLNELKVTQAQLIQSEKMASLGVLIAGIAHEIQNPLNFVNNFSEVNRELIHELKSEKSLSAGQAGKVKSERDVQLEIDILNDIDANEEKIYHHGKRADGIVKGLLQHSRSSSGVKEPTDINALADEYLRLSYHGLRAKDNSLSAGQAGFNATMKTDFDESIGNINIIPQDIGRVLLNLYNNAFYAVNEKKKRAGDSYEPTVSVSTKKLGDKVEIKVADNGNGIPQKVVDKIFQPFFTTKPTGQGTGLGLSLSYDIIKVHGGEIKVESTEGEKTMFIIELPIS